MENKNTNLDEINLQNLARSFWKAKFFILFFTTIFAISAVYYAISLPNIYKSEATLIDPNENSSGSSNLASIADRYSGLASMAGISLGGGSSSQSDVALAMLNSRDFFSRYYNDKDLLRDLISYKQYDELIKKDIYFSKNTSNNKNFDSSFKIFREHFSFSKDIKSNLITLSFEHQSPAIAKKWLQKIIFDINKYVKDKELRKATATYDILTNEIASINNPDLNFMVSKLAEKQIQTITLSKVTDEFAFTVIDSPFKPENKFKPYRSWIVILITFIGFLISSFVVLLSYYLGFFISLKATPPFIKFIDDKS